MQNTIRDYSVKNNVVVLEQSKPTLSISDLERELTEIKQELEKLRL